LEESRKKRSRLALLRHHSGKRNSVALSEWQIPLPTPQPEDDCAACRSNSENDQPTVVIFVARYVSLESRIRVVQPLARIHPRIRANLKKKKKKTKEKKKGKGKKGKK